MIVRGLIFDFDGVLADNGIDGEDVPQSSFLPDDKWLDEGEVATALGASRTTLIKLMDDLRLPRATELGEEEIARARAEAGGDLDAAARLLRVSPRALKKRLTQLGTET